MDVINNMKPGVRKFIEDADYRMRYYTYRFNSARCNMLATGFIDLITINQIFDPFWEFTDLQSFIDEYKLIFPNDDLSICGDGLIRMYCKQEVE